MVSRGCGILQNHLRDELLNSGKFSARPSPKQKLRCLQASIRYCGTSVRLLTRVLSTKLFPGLKKIERLAERESRLLLKHGLRSHEVDLPYIDDELRLELMTRVRVKPKFRAALSGEFEHDVLNELEDVFFGLTFPTP